MKVASARPLNKVMAGMLASAATVLVVWALKQFAGVELPVEVAGALSTIIGAVIAYLVPLAPGEVEPLALPSDVLPITVHWSEADDAYIATSTKYSTLSGFGDTEPKAVYELQTVLKLVRGMEAEYTAETQPMRVYEGLADE